MPHSPQPPSSPGPAIGFIGAGRVATTLAMAWSAAGIPVVGAASRNPDSARTLVDKCPRHQPPAAFADAQTLADRCDLVFLTVPDSAIETAARSFRWRPGQAVVHCSAATEISALNKAADDGAAIGGFHPLQLFANPEVALAQLAGTRVAIEAGDDLRSLLERLAAMLGMRPFRLPEGSRVQYHIAGNLAASGILAVLKEATDIWERCGLPASDALEALLPLTRGTLAAAMNRGLDGAIAGPVSRGDCHVIARHLDALSNAGEDVELYAKLLARQLKLAEASGRLTDAGAAEIRGLLAEHDAPRGSL